jgi:hypothetical protein
LRHGRKRAFRSAFPGEATRNGHSLATSAADRGRALASSPNGSGERKLAGRALKRVLPTIERFTVLCKPSSWHLLGFSILERQFRSISL